MYFDLVGAPIPSCSDHVLASSSHHSHTHMCVCVCVCVLPWQDMESLVEDNMVDPRLAHVCMCARGCKRKRVYARLCVFVARDTRAGGTAAEEVDMSSDMLQKLLMGR